MTLPPPFRNGSAPSSITTLPSPGRHSRFGPFEAWRTVPPGPNAAYAIEESRVSPSKGLNVHFEAVILEPAVHTRYLLARPLLELAPRVAHVRKTSRRVG